MGLCDRSKGRVCTKKGESISIVEERKRESKGVCLRAAKEGIYLTIQVTIDSTGIFCKKEGWEGVDGTRLLVFE